MADFDGDAKEKFIDIVRQHENLWKTSSKEFKDKADEVKFVGIGGDCNGNKCQ